MNYVRTVLPAITVTALVPMLTIFSGPVTPVTTKLLSLWSWLPVAPNLTHRLFAIFTKDTTKQDRLYDVSADMPFIRRATFMAGMASTISFYALSYRLKGASQLFLHY